ncbi:MAG: hypothetical protein IH623_05675 [Verrucomicrobia bacterium]|nr:hypothetical protein [Verrucomicrobiota bacterium]
MSYIGTITARGIVTLPPEADLPAGTRVAVTPLDEASPTEGTPEANPTLFEMFRGFVGVCEGPADLAQNHDHYAHGTPKP